MAPPPTVRAPLTILSCESTESHVIIIYECSCHNFVHVRVYRNGIMLKYAKPLDDSIEQRFPKVKVDWVGERVRIESVCDCNAGCRFTREDGGSGAVQVIAKLTSAL